MPRLVTWQVTVMIATVATSRQTATVHVYNAFGAGLSCALNRKFIIAHACRSQSFSHSLFGMEIV